MSDNTIYGTFGGENTKDKLFLINESQANQYKDILANFLTDFWLIGPGDEQNKAQFVSMGKVMKEGYRVDDRNIRLRPAMWITYK